VPAEQAAIETMHKMRAEGATLRAIAEALASTGSKSLTKGSAAYWRATLSRRQPTRTARL
jgi:hypothetical protein